jgi:tetratricopeptide (TPR) repeat protein
MTLKAAGFFAWAAVAAILIRRGGRLAVAGYGMASFWILFLVELTSVRLQEPFVLYRSYLWAPGLIIAACAFLAYLPRRIAIAAVLVAAPLLALQARDRLQSFSSPLVLWEDAVAKLPPGVPGGYRTLVQLGRERLYADQPEGAVAITERCIAEYPQRSECYLARGAVALQLERYEDALPYLTRAVDFDPKSAIAHHHRGVALEELGRREDAIAEYRIAAAMNYGGAQYRLKYMDQRAKEREARKRAPKAP